MRNLIGYILLAIALGLALYALVSGDYGFMVMAALCLLWGALCFTKADPYPAWWKDNKIVVGECPTCHSDRSIREYAFPQRVYCLTCGTARLTKDYLKECQEA